MSAQSEENTRKAALDLRAAKMGFTVDAVNRQLLRGCYYIAANKPTEWSYEKRVHCLCENLDQVEAFLVAREKGESFQSQRATVRI